MNLRHSEWLVRGLSLWLIGLLGSDLVGAEREKLSRRLRANGSTTLNAVAELDSRVERFTVSIVDGDETVALGTVVDEGGWIVSKASELGWKTEVRLPDGTQLIPTTVMVDEENDLALLRVGHEFEFAPSLELGALEDRGRILVAPATTRQRVKMGIVSANARAVERVGGALGVVLGRQGAGFGGVEVREVVKESAAANAGILAGDVIRSVNEKVVLLTEQVIQEVAAHNPGDNVVIDLQRGGESLKLDVILGFRSTYFGHFDRNQRLSGKTSTRLAGFQEIMQHDIPINVDAMGGPVLDLDGNVVGINIAKADRVSTYALPASFVKQIVMKLGVTPEVEE